ncbi:MAG TPA: cation:proton antiporter [Terriglobia bacterium]|nr:cation:proton antiporter [Terriglobia bacterium]
MSFATALFAFLTDHSASSGGPSFGTRSVWLAIILLIAGVFYVIEKTGQPAVLGELLAGVLLGNLWLLGVHFLEPMKSDEVIGFLARFGLALLLFQIGLQANTAELRRVGIKAFFAASAGVVTTCVVAGFVAGRWIMPANHHDLSGYLFLGAILAATSASVSVRVLIDLGRLQTREGTIILGAAVMDDVMSLLLLAVAAAGLAASRHGGGWDFRALSWIALRATGFFCIAIVGGRLAAPRLAIWLARISVEHKMKLILAFVFFLAYSFGAEKAGLEPAIGAFAAGLALEPVRFQEFRDPFLVEQLRETVLPAETQGLLGRAAARHLEELVGGPVYIFAPVFFVLTGMMVDIRAFGSLPVLRIAAILFFAAVLGKLACGLGVGKGVNRWVVGTAMIARGEVQLLGANLGLALGVISHETFTAIIVVVILTTFATPLFLSRLLRRLDTHPLAEP